MKRGRQLLRLVAPPALPAPEELDVTRSQVEKLSEDPVSVRIKPVQRAWVHAYAVSAGVADGEVMRLLLDEAFAAREARVLKPRRPGSRRRAHLRLSARQRVRAKRKRFRVYAKDQDAEGDL